MRDFLIALLDKNIISFEIFAGFINRIKFAKSMST
jgi:hypothetical protein